MGNDYRNKCGYGFCWIVMTPLWKGCIMHIVVPLNRPLFGIVTVNMRSSSGVVFLQESAVELYAY